MFNPLRSYVSANSNWVQPPRQPWENFFERANPGHPAIFLSNSLPWGENDGRIPGGAAKFSQTRRNCSLSLQKILKKLQKLRDSTNFIFGELNTTFILIFSAEGRCPLTVSFVICKSLVRIKFLQMIVILPKSPQTFTWGGSQN